MLDSAPGILQSGVLMTALSVRGCATPGTAANAPATPCTVSDTCTPHFRQRRDVSGTPDLSIGRNYDAHAIEMVSQTPPARRVSFFQKPAGAIQVVAPGRVTDHSGPPIRKKHHYKVDLVAALSKVARALSASRCQKKLHPAQG